MGILEYWGISRKKQEIPRGYDSGLKDRLSANNNGNGVVLNGNFSRWNEHITENLKNRYPGCGPRYNGGTARALLGACKEHARGFQQNMDGKNTIMLTHPFYLQLSHMGHLKNEGVRREVDEYTGDLLGFLKLNQDELGAGAVALETIHHYAAVTSLLVEQGLIDRVIFTEYDTGRPLDKDELIEFKWNQVFFGGGYNERCLSRSILEMAAKASSNQLWAIRELVLNSPQDVSKTLRTSTVDGLRSSHVIGLEEVVSRLS